MVIIYHVVVGHRQAVRHQTLTLTFPGFESLCPSQKNPTRKSWIFSFVPIGTTSFAWHTQHHLTVRSTSLPLAAQMNEVEALPQMMLQQVANDVMLRINDVALRANGHAFAARRSVGECLGAPVFGAEGFREEQAPPLRSGVERANHGAKRSYPCARKRTVEDACPYN